MRRGLVIAVGWVSALAAGTALGVATISTLGDAGPRAPLSQAEVNDRLAQTPQAGPTTATPEPATPPATTASPARRYFTTSGGSLWATCANGQATLDTLTPRSGYRLDDSDRGPATAAWARFKLDVQRGHATEYHVTVTCPAGLPQVAETADN